MSTKRYHAIGISFWVLYFGLLHVTSDMQFYSTVLDVGVILGLLVLLLSILYRLKDTADNTLLDYLIVYLVLTPLIGFLVLPDTTAVPHNSYFTRGLDMVDTAPRSGIRRTDELTQQGVTIRTYGTFVFEPLGYTAQKYAEPPLRGDVTFSLVASASEWPRYTHFVQSTLVGDEHALNAWLRDAIATCAEREGPTLRTAEKQGKRIETFRARMLGCLSTITDPHAIHAVSLELYYR